MATGTRGSIDHDAPLTVLGVAYSLRRRAPSRSSRRSIALWSRPAIIRSSSLIAVRKWPEHWSRPARCRPASPMHERALARARHRRAIARVLAEFRVDVVHSHAIDFADTLPESDVPTLVTLHLPREFYPSARWRDAAAADLVQLRLGKTAAQLPAISKDATRDRERRARWIVAGAPCPPQFALCLGRICPEKGYEHALDAARLARTPLLIGGEVSSRTRRISVISPTEIRPRLGPQARFLGPVGWVRKRRC